MHLDSGAHDRSRRDVDSVLRIEHVGVLRTPLCLQHLHGDVENAENPALSCAALFGTSCAVLTETRKPFVATGFGPSLR